MDQTTTIVAILKDLIASPSDTREYTLALTNGNAVQVGRGAELSFAYDGRVLLVRQIKRASISGNRTNYIPASQIIAVHTSDYDTD